MNNLKKLTALSATLVTLGFTSTAGAFDLQFIEGTATPAPYVTYGDGNSYSLPVLGIIYDILNGGGFTSSIQPGNPYYVVSTPGAIKDLTVIGTGSDGQPVTTNFAGMDNSYPTPNSDGLAFFSTNKTAYGGSCAGCSLPADPGQVAPFTGDGADTWDIRLDALSSFLGTESPVFFFNNNQTNSGDSEDQNLAIWARLSLYDDAGGDPLNLYFSNLGGAYALVSEGGGGVLNGTAGSGTVGAPVGPVAGDNTSTDYVLSGGELCYTAALSIVSCGDPNAVGGPINHNLGANQAVYAVVFPALNEILGIAGFLGYDVLSIDWRMGCDPFTTADCDGSEGNHGRSLNNGFEQLFIGKASSVVNVPEPGTLALLGVGLGLLGFGAMRRRYA